jgi:Flp pilus assembly pilin Flp
MEGGQTLVEYSLIVGLIAVVAISGLTAFAGGTDGLYGICQQAADAMADALGA